MQFYYFIVPNECFIMQPGPTIQPSPYSNLARAGLHPHGHERPPQRTFYIQARILPYWLATKNCQMIPNNPNISKYFTIQSNISKYDQILSEYCPTSNISAYQRLSIPLSFHSPGDRIWKDLGLIQALPVRCGVGGTQSHIACQHVVRAWQCCIWLQWFNRLTMFNPSNMMNLTIKKGG